MTNFAGHGDAPVNDCEPALDEPADGLRKNHVLLLEYARRQPLVKETSAARISLATP